MILLNLKMDYLVLCVGGYLVFLFLESGLKVLSKEK